MNKRHEVACALAGLVGVVAILVGLIVADYLPPPKANWTPTHLATHYAAEYHRIRVGVLIMLVAVTGWAALMAVTTTQLLRSATSHTMAWLNAMAGAATYMLLTLFCVFLAAAAFRPNRASVSETQLLHDVGWFMAFLAAPPFVTQAAAVGVGVLSDRGPTAVYPRWLGWLGIWVALLLAPGTILMFFHSGVFAYHGLISYWIPVFTFGGWMAAMSLAAFLHATRREPAPA